MLKKIVKGYGALLRSIVGFIALLAVAVAFGAAIVWPLWRLADASPSLYTVVFSGLFALVVAFVAGTRMRLAFRRDRRGFLLSVARKLTIIAGVVAPVLLVLSRARLLALVALVLAVALYGFLAFGLSSPRRAEAADE
jgi:Ca2+/Na+ antiporter